MRRYQDVAFPVAYTIVGSAEKAEDAAQEGSVRAYRAIHRFRAGAPLRPWLLTIVANAARTQRTAAGRRPALVLDSSALDARADSAPAPEASALSRELQSELLAAVAALREDDHPLIVSRYYLGLSESETAPGLPAAGKTGAGAVLTQFAGRTERSLIEKGVQGPSGSGEPETLLESVTVRGELGYWITGAPHAVLLVCSGVGECRQQPYRLAGDVLLWEHQGVTLRLEVGLSWDATLVIAESIRPIKHHLRPPCRPTHPTRTNPGPP